MLFSAAATAFTLPPARIPISSHPHEYLFPTTAAAGIIVVLVGMKWYCILCLICISSVTKDVEYLFMYHFMAICTSSLEKCLYKSIAHFLYGRFVFCYGVGGSLYILNIEPLSNM